MDKIGLEAIAPLCIRVGILVTAFGAISTPFTTII